MGATLMFPIGLSTGIAYKHPIESVLPAIARAGIRTVEIATSRGHIDLHDRPRLAGIRASLDGLELHAQSLHAPFGHHVDITDPSPEFRRRSFELLDLAVEGAAALGAPMYVIHPGGEDSSWTWDRDARIQLSVEGLRRMHERCRSAGLQLVVETALPHLLGGEPADLHRILAQLPADVGVCLDTSHASLGKLLYQTVDRFSERLVHIQASDNHGHTDDHLPPGLGHIDWRRLVAALEHERFRGVIMLEVTGHTSPEGDVAACVEAARKFLPGVAW